MSILSDLVAEARLAGWASGTALMPSLQAAIALHGWTARPNRSGGPVVDVLTPVRREHARTSSLSAMSGIGAQPLHTDGAHSRNPPDIVVLAAPKRSDVSTMVWKLPRHGLPAQILTDLQHGLFLVSSGGNSFLAPALESGRLRYDPGCMSPADERARRVRDFFADALGSATAHRWDSPGDVLVINNRTALHARDDAAAEPERALHRIAITIPREKT